MVRSTSRAAKQDASRTDLGESERQQDGGRGTPEAHDAVDDAHPLLEVLAEYHNGRVVDERSPSAEHQAEREIQIVEVRHESATHHADCHCDRADQCC